MKQFILNHKKAITGALAMLLVGGITMSFQDSPLGYSKFTGEDEFVYEGCCYTDTLPDKAGIKMKDFDKLQAELDKTLGKVDAELRGMDFTKIQKEAAELALKEIDMDKIMKNVELALKSIDLDKVMAEVSASLKNVKQNVFVAKNETAPVENKTRRTLKGITG